jgi:hypothetical protein
MTSITETYRRIGLRPSVGQLAFAKSVLSEPLCLDEQEVRQLCSGRQDCPQGQFQEVTGLIGRKGGKTEYVAAPLLVHRACTDEDDPGTYLLVAPSKSDQARLGWEAINRQLERGFPNLIADVQEASGRIVLHNGNDIKIASANFRFLRGPKYKVVIIDEACFFVSDTPEDGGANPLPFILDSVVGGMVATANPLLLLLSTPWNKSGVVWEHFRDRDANPDRLLWRASTLLMNPSANGQLMERHRKDRGENFYRREYLAEFSEDAIAYIEWADIDAAIAGVPFFPPKPGVRYCMGLDPGRKRDHFGAAVAHKESDNTVIVDWCAEWKPGLFGLKYANILPQIWQRAREYGAPKIASDQIEFGGIEASIPNVNGVPEFQMERVMTGGQSGAELADVTRALFAQHKLVLPNEPGLADEFKRLADYLTQGGGRDIRAKRGHDDRSRAVMLAVYQAFKRPQAREPIFEVIHVDTTPHPKDPADLYDAKNDYGFSPRRGPSFGPR